MNLRALVELTTTISSHSPHLIEAGTKLSFDALQRYWSCSRARARLWLSRLTDFPAEMASASPERQLILREAIVPLLADVFTGDLTTRVWGAVVSAADLTLGQPYGEPIVKSVLSQQESLRNRALKLILSNPGLPAEQASALDRHRRRLERWTDVLVGHLVRRYHQDDFAFDVERAREFGEEQLEDSWGTGAVQAWDLYLVCLRSSFPDAVLPGGRLGELRDGIAHSMLAAFPSDSYLEFGPLQSVGLRRLLTDCARLDNQKLPVPPRPSRGSGRVHR